MPQQKIQDTQFGIMAGFASTTCITQFLLLFLLYVLVYWIGWSTIADQAVGLLFLLYVLVLYTYTTTYTCTCMLNWMINFCSPGCLNGWRCLWIQTRQRIRPKNWPKLKHTSSQYGRDSKEHKFSGHLQLAFEDMPVQELILLVLAEEVRRLVGTARQGNHCPVVTLMNMIWTMWI